MKPYQILFDRVLKNDSTKNFITFNRTMNFRNNSLRMDYTGSSTTSGTSSLWFLVIPIDTETAKFSY
jgi:hypothetical protein